MEKAGVPLVKATTADEVATFVADVLSSKQKQLDNQKQERNQNQDRMDNTTSLPLFSPTRNSFLPHASKDL